MRLISLPQRNLDEAVQLYEEGLQWSPVTIFPGNHLIHAFTAPNSQWWCWVDHNLLIALAGFERISWIDRCAEPYVAVSPKHRKQGLGKVLGEALLEKGLKDLNLHRIQTTVLNGSPSIPILEHLNFTKEGTLHKVRYKDGTYQDAHLFSWVRKE